MTTRYCGSCVRFASWKGRDPWAAAWRLAHTGTIHALYPFGGSLCGKVIVPPEATLFLPPIVYMHPRSA